MSTLTFIRLRALNCLTWGRLDIPLNREGLVLLVGPNGSGKTNILEIILYLLFDKTVKSGGADRMVNRKVLQSGGKMAAQLDFRIGKTRYRIYKSREKGSPSTRFYENGNEISCKRVSDTQKLILDKIGFGFNECLSRIILPHQAMHPLVTGTLASRTEYITHTYGLDQIDLLRKQLEVARKELRGCDVVSLRKQVEEASKELAALPKRATLVLNIEEVRRQRSLLQGEMSKLDGQLVTLTRKQAGQERRLRLEKTIAPTEDPKDLRAFITQRRKQETALRERWQGLRRRFLVEEEIQRAEKSPRVDRPDIPLLQEKRTNAAKALAVEQSKSEIICPSCGKVHKIVSCTGCRTKISLVQDAATIKALSLAHDESELQLEAAERKLKQWERYQRDIETWKGELENLPEGEVKSVEKELRKLTSTVEKAEASLRESIRSHALREELSSLPTGNPDATRRLVEKRGREVKALRQKDAGLAEEFAKLKQQLQHRDRLSVSLDAATKELTNNEHNAARAAVLDDAIAGFGNREIKLELMRSILDGLSQEVSSYTRDLLPEYSFSLTPNESAIGFSYVDEHGTTADVSALSSGEKKRLSIALLLAERHIGRVHPNLLLLDEFDGGLDIEGRVALLEILQELTSHYSTIVAISHQSDVQESGVFSKSLKVSRHKGLSALS